MKYKYIVLILILTLFITGCTNKDGVEINKREYIFAVGIDKSEKHDSEYTFTAEVPIISTGSENKRYVTSQNSDNLTDFYYNNIFSTEKIISDSLMQVIVLGESVAKNPDSIKRLFDEIERSPQINRKVKLVVAKSKASDIINYEIKDNPLIGRYISEFLIKLKKLRIQSTYSFDEVAVYLQGFGNALIPSVEVKDDRVAIDGAAIIKDYKLIGYIDHVENRLLSLLTKGEASGMTELSVFIDGIPITLTAEDVVVSQMIDLKDEKLNVTYYVTVSCNVTAYDMTKVNTSDKDFIRRLSNEVNNKVNNHTKNLIYKIQKNYKMDMLEIKQDLMKYKKADYNKIKDKYNEIFENANIVVNYNVKINNSGMVK